MGRYDDEDRERPSWSEIDKMRDGSRHVSRDKPSRAEKSLKSQYAKQLYLKRAEDLFKGAKTTPEYKAAHQAIHDNFASTKFHTVAKKFIKAYGLPEDWGTLMLLLDYKDLKVVKDAMGAMIALLGKKSLVEQQGFKGKLRVMAMTSDNDEVVEAVEEALKNL